MRVTVGRARSARRALVRWGLAVILAGSGLVTLPAAVGGDVAGATAISLPPGFQNQVVLGGLTFATDFAFSPDGRVFVTEKAGRVKVFDGLDDPTPSVFADLTTQTYNFSDRGMLGLALAPNFPHDPYVYVAYTLDAPIGGTPPRWNDTCPTPPGQLDDGCVTSARVSRLRASGNVMVGPEQVLLEDWCAQFPSHTIGTLAFGPDGALYAGGGEGASWGITDFGQAGGSLAGTPTPRNPCGDPPGGVGGAMSPPSAEGGALRAQDLLTPSDPTGLSGSIVRIDPETGAPLADNPNAGASDANARRIVATGLRNPYRFAFRPGTTDLWIGDVGWGVWEEVNRHPDARASVRNFGWPCYEGPGPQPGYQALGLAMCQALYQTPGSVTMPTYRYRHDQTMVPGDGCLTGTGAVSALAFYNGGSLPGPVGTYPTRYDGALFVADFAKKCMSVMLTDENGIPDPGRAEAFASNIGGAAPVAMHAGPGGDLYWLDLFGSINRIRYFAGNRPPEARLRSDATSGSVPLTVNFDASDSIDADGDPLTYTWDLDGNGTFGDATGPTAQRTFTDTASHTVRVRVTDTLGASDTAQVVVRSGNRAPTVTIDAPTPSTTWKVGDVISFSATATDPDDGALPAAAYDWTLTTLHCPGGVCHEHPLEQFHGVRSGSFVAPDHEYPARLRLDVVAADAGGVTAEQRVEILPQTTTLTTTSNADGAVLAIDGDAQVWPLTHTVIVGSRHVVTAPLQQVGGVVRDFDKWSDDGAQTHTVVVPNAMWIHATLSRRDARIVDAVVNEPASGSSVNAVVPVRLNAKASRPVSLEYQTIAGTAGSGDFTPGVGVVVFPPGSTEQTILVPVRGDTSAEGHETFTVRLSSPQNANLVRTDATVRIQNDPTPRANAGADQSVAEGGDSTTIDGSASTGSPPLTYRWDQIDGPLAVIEDRTRAVTRITMPNGASRVTFRLTVTDASGRSNSDDVTVTAPK
jgi:glucose/arabinose dehydrogenase